MELDMEQVLTELNGMTVGQLQQRYAEVCGEQARSWNRAWLVKRIAWKVQANAYGDLSERAHRRALELASKSDVRLKAPASCTGETTLAKLPPARPPVDKRLPVPGTVIVRKYKRRTYKVTVLAEGFEFCGEAFGSLSAIAQRITGSHWNGFKFFGLTKSAGGAR